MKTNHKCDYCRCDLEYIEVLAREYRAHVEELDAKVAALSGGEEAEELRCKAAGLDEERSSMEACFEARWMPGMEP